MNNTIFKFICDCETWKTVVKSFHWNSPNLSQHSEMDSLLDEISDFQDIASEVEQSISGNLPYNKLKAHDYNMTTIQKFMEDIIAKTTTFCNKLKTMGDKYIGLHSECESFLAKLQQRSYRINFTIKEDFKRNYARKINETMEEFEEDVLNDAREALEMSDGQIDFYDWSDAYNEEDENYLKMIWNQACHDTGNEALIEESMNEFKKHRIVKMNGKQLQDCLQEAIVKSVNKFMNENSCGEAEVKGGMYNDKELNFTHFAINKVTNLIVDGWDYSGYDTEDLKQDKVAYFYDDLKGNGFNPKMYKILSFKACQRQGVDPNNKSLWSNTGVYPLSQEAEMNRKGVNIYLKAQQEHSDWFIEN